MSCPALEVIDRAIGAIHYELQTTRNPDPSAELREARQRIAELVEAVESQLSESDHWLEARNRVVAAIAAVRGES